MTTYAPQEAAARAGVSIDTLRYYEKIRPCEQSGPRGFALRPGPFVDDVPRTSGNQRVYDESHLDWLGVLTCLRRSGMPVREMRRYAELARDGEATEDERLRILEEHRRAVLASIAELERALRVVDDKIDW